MKTASILRIYNVYEWQGCCFMISSPTTKKRPLLLCPQQQLVALVSPQKEESHLTRPCWDPNNVHFRKILFCWKHFMPNNHLKDVKTASILCKCYVYAWQGCCFMISSPTNNSIKRPLLLCPQQQLVALASPQNEESHLTRPCWDPSNVHFRKVQM